MSVNPVHHSFSYDSQTNKSQCTHCNTKMSGKHTENLARHMKRKHPEIFEEILAKKRQKKDDIDNSITKYMVKKSTTATVTICKQQLLDGCVELVTKNGRPLEDSGFRKIIDPLCRAVDISINRQNVKQEIVKRAAKLRSSLTSTLKDRIISIKVDCVSRLDRSIIGINVQFIENGKMQILTLAMKEVYVKQTGLNLANIIMNVLRSFGTTMDQIYSMTVDNAPNMISTGKFLNKNVQKHDKENMGKDVLQVVSIDDSEDDEESDHDDDEEDECSDEDEELDEDDNEENINTFANVFEELKSNLAVHESINVIRCAAHTLNLAVSDFLKEVKEICSKARTVVKKLRTPTLLNLLRMEKIRKPILDCVTRWGSTYKMLKRLLQLKSFCMESAADIKELYMSEYDWQQIANICVILNPPYEASIKLQKKDLILSDMYFEWSKCKLKVEKQLGWLSLKFASALKQRGELFLRNPYVLAAVYLDARFQILLPQSDKALAKEHLIRTFTLKSKFMPTASGNESPQSSKISSDEDLELMLEQLDKQDEVIDKKSVVDVINSFDKIKRLPQHTNILKFWQNYPNKDLKDVADIILAAPATQVSVERAFSTLKFILSDLRASIDQDLLEDILLLNLNN